MFTYLHGYYDQNEVCFWLWEECIHLWWHSNQSTVGDHRYNTHCFKSQLKEKKMWNEKSQLRVCSVVSDSLRPHGPVARQVPLCMEIFLARILKRVAISFSRGSSWPKDQTHASCIGRQTLYHSTTWEAQKPQSLCPYVLLLFHII